MLSNLHYRHELKHLITTGDAMIIKSRLSSLLPVDSHAGREGHYQIRSLYFDTPENKALHEKLEGLPVKEKYRIRYYNYDHSLIVLEKKYKYYGLGRKSKANLSKQETLAILNGSICFLKNSPQAVCRDFYYKLVTACLEPKIVVDYRREAFFYPSGNVRITIDSNIRGSFSGTDLFDPDLPVLPVIGDDLSILEVKYDQYLPEFIQDIVQLNKFTTSTFSKYAAGRLYH